jgi:nicotinamidase-related amidase
VRACALGLAFAEAQVLLVEDAVRGVSAESTRRTIEEMRDAGVEFITSEKLVGSKQ